MTILLAIILVAFAITTWYTLLIRFHTPHKVGLFAILATTLLLTYTVVDLFGVFTGMAAAQIVTVIVCYFVLGGLATVCVIVQEAAMRAVFVATYIEGDDTFYGDPDIWKHATNSQRDAVLNQLKEWFMEGSHSEVKMPPSVYFYTSAELNDLIAEIVGTPILLATATSFFFWPVYLLCEGWFRTLIVIEEYMESRK